MNLVYLLMIMMMVTSCSHFPTYSDCVDMCRKSNHKFERFVKGSNGKIACECSREWLN